MLDTITSVFTYGIAQLACALAMLFVWFWNPSIKGVKEWGVGRMLIFAATVLISMRNIIPLPLSSIGGHFLFLSGAYIIWDGFVKFLGYRVKKSRILMLIGSALFLTAMVYGTVIQPSFIIRMNVTSLAAIFFMGGYIWLFYTTPRKGEYRSIRFLRIICYLIIIQLLLRLFIYAYGLAGSTLESAGNWTALTFISDIFLHVLMSMATLGLTVEYLQKELTNMAERDQLTGAYNRRSFFTIIENLFAGMKRDEMPVAVCYIDLDHFKSVNDTYGHVIGDLVLSGFVDMVETIIRDHDLFARFGGEEFVIVLPDTTREHAWEIAERIRETIIKQSFDQVPEGYITCSIGVAAVDKLTDAVSIDALLEHSDEALYHAKHSGRNMVCIY